MRRRVGTERMQASMSFKFNLQFSCLCILCMCAGSSLNTCYALPLYFCLSCGAFALTQQHTSVLLVMCLLEFFCLSVNDDVILIHEIRNILTFSKQINTQELHETLSCVLYELTKVYTQYHQRDESKNNKNKLVPITACQIQFHNIKDACLQRMKDFICMMYSLYLLHYVFIFMQGFFFIIILVKEKLLKYNGGLDVLYFSFTLPVMLLSFLFATCEIPFQRLEINKNAVDGVSVKISNKSYKNNKQTIR